MPSRDGASRSRKNRSGKKWSSRSSKVNSPGPKDAFEMSDGTHDSYTMINPKSTTKIVVRPVDAEDDHHDDTASEECIIQKHNQSSSVDDEPDNDVEKGPLRVMIETRYDVRPTSAMPVAKLEDEPTRSPERYVASSHGRFWDQSWQDRGFGNSVMVGSKSGGPYHR